ncbi:cytochrome C assembly family protein [Thalassolituus maritimus]|uniref:Inner membrane protein YpjD n=1 Tax=Thalassolituus maritimus TaxID=484498 RepID=A0ABP9ZVD6_9GAMM
MTALILAAFAAGFYILAAGRQLMVIGGIKPPHRPFLLITAASGAVLHAAALSQTMLTPIGLNLAMFQVGSLISLIITNLLLFSAWKKPVDNLFSGLLPMGAVICVLAAFAPHLVILSNISYALMWHILLSVIAFSLFTIAAVQAVMVLLQDRSLRRHQLQGLVRSLPPLQTMDALLFEILWLAMTLLTGAFMIGFPAIDNLSEQHLIHKVVFSVIAWVVFAILLFGRYRFGWRGPTASRWTLTGTGFLVLAYFGSQFVLEYVLQRA